MGALTEYFEIKGLSLAILGVMMVLWLFFLKKPHILEIYFEILIG